MSPPCDLIYTTAAAISKKMFHVFHPNSKPFIIQLCN